VQRRGSPEKAGRHVAVVASAPQLRGHTGQYFEAKPTPRRLSARELDGELQERAWQLGTELVARAPPAAGARPQANSQLVGRRRPSQTEGNQAEWPLTAGLSALEGDDTRAQAGGWTRG
jgi:hypothetical protein